MAADEPEDETRILPPDMSLYNKIGKPDMNKVFAPEIVQAAQQVIVEAATTLMDETKEALNKIKQAQAESEKDPQKTAALLPVFIEQGFFIKARTGLSNYNLVAEMAKSLQIYCEAINKENITTKDRDIIKWHVQSIDMLLTKDIKGDGGPLGATIMDEIRRLGSIAKG